MSSPAVRTAILEAVEAAAGSWDVLNLSDYISLEDALSNNDSSVVLVQFVVASEEVISTGGPGNQGWEEDGTVVIHLVIPLSDSSTAVLAKGDEIQKALRGTRPNTTLTIEACEPFSDVGKAVGLYGGTWKGWAANLFYSNHDCG